VRAGSDVIREGEDFPAGKRLLEHGLPITSAGLAVLATQGVPEVAAYKRPLVSILSIGTELVPFGEALPYAKIYNSSRYMLDGFLRGFGTDILDLGVVADDPNLIAEAVTDAAARSDMVVTTGGVSVGDYDMTAEGVRLAGATELFYKVAMRPGGSILAATLNGRVILSLSGSPGAAAIGLLHIALPFIRGLCGRTDVYPEICTILLKEPVTKPSPVARILRGKLAVEDGKAWLVSEKNQGGGDVASLVQCELLVEIPQGSPALEAGTPVLAYRIA